MPVVFLNSGNKNPNKPDCSVEVVDDITMDWATACAVMPVMTRPKARCRTLRDNVENLEIERIKFLLAEIKKLDDCVASDNRLRKNQQ